ncbi:MAG: Monooxygenase, FAD-binding protein [Polaromonas sp.]|nr:Monooxygenase, FAD-binding protein [Polaromonas sp.]
MKIAIVGGGPSGLYLAILVKKRQPSWSVSVVEQNVADSTFGFGVVLADSGLARIQAADPQVYEKLIEKMTFTGCQTINVKEQPIDINHPAKGGAIARIDLLHVLQETAVEAGVDVRFSQRISHPRDLGPLGLGDADVVVGADGVNSVVRAAHEEGFGTTRSLLTNHFAWFGTRKVFEKSALVFRTHEGGSFVAHYYPYCATGSTFVTECDHATWLKLGMQAMTDDQRQQLFEQVFAPELDGEKLISNNSNWRQFPVTRNRHWTVGNCVLIGDAQTSAHFSIGSGTRIAMEDSIALAEALTQEAAPGTAEPTALQRLANFALKRGPDKDKLLTASRKSYLWYENIGEWMQRYSPFEFIHAFMTRTGRMSNDRLAHQYPELFAQFEQAGVLNQTAQHEESGHPA